jgi:hypothetical protein
MTDHKHASHHVLAGHLETERLNLQDAHERAVNGPPDLGPIQSSLPSQVIADRTVTNQHWRNPRGSLRGQGVDAAADVPGHELLAAGWNNRHPRESATLEGNSAEAYLGRRPAPVTSTRVRPSDYPEGDEYEYGDNQ